MYVLLNSEHQLRPPFKINFGALSLFVSQSQELLRHLCSLTPLHLQMSIWKAVRTYLNVKKVVNICTLLSHCPRVHD